METLAEKIQRAVREERYVFGAHADMRLRERRILGWQIVEGLEHATPLRERLDGIPHPVTEFEQILPDGTRCRVAWAWIEAADTAKLVTVFIVNG
jgi:hypothetical protein